MFKWLRKVVKRWLSEEEERVTSLECFIEGKIQRMAVGLVHGMKLEVWDPHGAYLVGPEKALNPHEFWKAWSQRTDKKPVWEDGSEFKPEG